MITRWTTPHHRFVIPIPPDRLELLYVTYSQNDNIIVERSIEDVEIRKVDYEVKGTDPPEFCECSSISVHLTQEETGAFTYHAAEEKNIILIQLRAIDVDGEAYVTYPQAERLYNAYKEGVI